MNAVPVIDMKRTGRNIEMLRERAGVSVKEIQDILGFASTHAIYKWQRGESLPTLDNIVTLSSILNVKIEDILIIKYI